MKTIINYLYIAIVTIFFAVLLLPFSEASAKEFVVVIDAGHGGNDHGAVDNNASEKNINLNVALQLSDLIKKNMKNVKVVLTRSDDTFRTLQDRADIANKAKGDLFISIHTNSVDKTNKSRTTVAGASVYTLGQQKEANNMNVARRENAVIQLEKNYEQKYQGFDPEKDESYIIFEMAQRKNLSKSIRIANDIEKQLVNVAGRKSRGVHQAGFWVLWATSMPAVLVELDFICNPTSASYLTSKEGEKQMATAIYNAVKAYVAKENATSEVTPSPQQLQREQEARARQEEASAKTLAESKKIEKEEAEGTVILAAHANEAPRHHVASAQKTDTATTRKRRAAGESKKQEVQTAVIPINTEAPDLAVVDDSQKSETSNAKNENKKTDNQKASKSSKAGNAVKVETVQMTANSRQRTHAQHLVSYYSIQICATSEKLKDSDPRFCGLSPLKSFKEHNLYKYTYGESKNKAEVEALLPKVKKDFPDAFIIETKKSAN